MSDKTSIRDVVRRERWRENAVEFLRLRREWELSNLVSTENGFVSLVHALQEHNLEWWEEKIGLYFG